MVGESPSMDAALGMVQLCRACCERSRGQALSPAFSVRAIPVTFNLDSLPLDPQLLGP